LRGRADELKTMLQQSKYSIAEDWNVQCFFSTDWPSL